MNKLHNGWIDYWIEDDLWKDLRIQKINSELFFRRAYRVLEFDKNDIVLDIGCGPGYLEALLAPNVKSIHAIDVSEQSVNSCKEKNRNFNNISADILGRDYTSLNTKGRFFSKILCISIVQYFKNMDEIEKLISSARKISLPGAKMLIVDLPLKRSKIGFIWDAMCTILMSIRYGYIISLLRAAFRRWLCNSRYKVFLKKIGILYFTINDLESLVHRIGLDAKIIRQNFSVYANRPSLLIRF